MAKLTGKNALICGDSRTLNLTFPFDLTGYTVFFTVKPENDTASDDSSAVIQKTVTTHEDAVAGLTNIELSPSDTRVAPGKYEYDIQAKSAGGDISSTVKMQIEFVNDITKRVA